MSHIGKKELEHLANLARIELHAHEEEKLLHDLEAILAHFDELKEVNTDNVAPLTGGTELKNIFREEVAPEIPFDAGLLREMFPDVERGYLKVPPVFE